MLAIFSSKQFDMPIWKINFKPFLFQERQEARMQVIAADLDQAQQVADFLQRMLDDRENQLHNELYQTELNNQMISM